MSNFMPKPDKTNHKVTEDKLVRDLHQTRPVGSKQHRDELEARLLGILTEQAQSTPERQSPMQIQARSNILALPKMRISPILAATIAMILIGGGLLFAFGSTGSPDNSGYGQQAGQTKTATPFASPTMVPGVDGTLVTPPLVESCPFMAIGTAVEDIPVYGLDSIEADLLGNFEVGDEFVIMGQSYTGNWLVVQWSEEYVGWVQTPATSDSSFTMVTCDDLLETTQDPNFNEMTATALPPTFVPINTLAETSTCISTVDTEQPAQAEAKNENTNVRETPDITATRVGVIHPDTCYVIRGSYFEWYQIVFPDSPNGIGWIHQSVINIRGDETSIDELTAEQVAAVSPTIVPTSTPIGQPGVASDCPIHQANSVLTLTAATVYARPDAEADIVDTFVENTIVDVIGVNFDQDWYVVNLNHDYVGWISVENTQILGCDVGANVTEIMISPTAVPPNQDTVTQLPPTVPPPAEGTATSTPIPAN